MEIDSTNCLISLLLLSLVTCGAFDNVLNRSNESPHNEQTVTAIPRLVNDSGLTERPNSGHECPKTSAQLRKSKFTRRNCTEVPEEKTPLTDYIQEHVLQIDGDAYLDIGAYNESSMEIPERLPSYVGNIYGITVVDGSKCMLQFLSMAKGFVLSENITRCNSLKNVTLAGNGWDCRIDWTWLEALKSDWNIDYSMALCSDVKSFSENGSVFLNFADGTQTWTNSELGVCPRRCRCVLLTNAEWQFKNLKVNCNKLNLTDEDILAMSIPSKTTILSLDENKLRSTEKLFKHISHLQSVTGILLNYNKLDELPYLPTTTFPKLDRLDLFNNTIRKINLEAFESIVSRDIWVNLHENEFLCDCNTHFFMKLLLKYPGRVKDYISKPFRCTSKPDNLTLLITLRTKECEPPPTEFNALPLVIALLVLLNAAFIYFVWDLHRAIKECKNTGNVKNPVVHILVKRVGRFFSAVLQKDVKPPETETSPFPDDLHDEMIRRNHRTSSHDRKSFFRRPESRMTPGPT
ncbi:uncharacterized protein LOC135223581 [Macrobrachium nipponense]|uniref:uncharacterized protein LOC135223581 n=1 Tax=Macrobrachium nipponense TaxID=159736 RepID=UPI0030C8A95B